MKIPTFSPIWIKGAKETYYSIRYIYIYRADRGVLNKNSWIEICFNYTYS